MPINFRDVQLKNQRKFDDKLDRTKLIRAVIVDELGLDSGSGNIWADRNARRVWVRELGTASASQCPCYNITPVIGLGVILGYEIGSNTREVLRSDKEFLGPTNPNGSSYESPSYQDFRPGGRLQLWLASKLIEPLATYPATGLEVNVVSGDYPYAGTRKTFTGASGFPLTQNPNAGEHYYAGLYLDSSNNLQVVYGASVILATTPPEPTWPAGAFRLSVVRINDTQTSIVMALDTDADNDIFDRRMAWSEAESGGGGNAWPLDGQNLLEAVNYASATLLLAAMSSGDIGYLGGRSSSEAVDVNVDDVTLQGVGRLAATFTDLFTVSAVLDRSRIEDIGVSIDGSGTKAILVTDGPVDFVDVKAEHIGVANCRGFQLEADARLYDCEGIATSTGTTARAVYATNNAVVEVHGGYFSASGGTGGEIYADGGSTILLDGPTLVFGGIAGAGTVFGWWVDILGGVHIVPGTDLTLVNPVDEFSTDGTLAGNSDTAVPTEKAVKTYVDANAGGGSGGPVPIINGAYQFWQRGTSFAAVANGTYTADRWVYYKIGTMVHTISQSSDVPTVAEAGIKAPFSLLLDCTTADGTIAASDVCIKTHIIEGSNFLNLAQQEFTLSFWVKGTKTGIHCVSFQNGGQDRSYVAEFTINTTATWEYKTITVTASPTAGTWDYTTGVGLRINFVLAAGSTFQTTAGAWQTGDFHATANQVNACDNAANDFRLALVKVEPGAVATPFVIPDWGQEKARCKRYYQLLGFGGMAGTWESATQALLYWLLDTEMRVAPTLSLIDASPKLIGISPTTGVVSSFTGAASTIAGSSLTPRAIAVELNGFTGATAGQFASVSGAQIADGDIVACSAEF